ncbi:MAG TPA: TolC family protein [Opitutaceae bacterium]|nr:TolC family protein [Opitutaceae bacterium]
MSPLRLSFLLLLPSVSVSVSGGPVWTVETAVATALRQNPDATLARERIAAAEAMVQQADAAWLPQVTLSGGYTRTNSALGGLMNSLNQRAFSFDQNFNRPGAVDNLNLTGTVAYSLYSGGQATARREAARAGIRASEMDLRTVQLQLSAEVVKTLLQLRKARESAAALEVSVKTHEALLTNARLRFEAGQLLKSDLLSLEVQTAQVRALLSSARRGAALAAQAFVFILGSDPSSDGIELAEHDPALAALANPETSDVTQRPELLGLRERLRAAEAMVAAARGGGRPNVNAFVSAQYDQGWVSDRHANSVQGGVIVDFKVFDGGQVSGRIRQAAAELEQVKGQLRKATLQAGLEVEQARLAHADARERLAVTSAAVAQAEESATLSRLRFEKGSLLASELIGSEGRLVEVRLSRTLAEADERSSLIDLRRALGLSPIALP